MVVGSKAQVFHGTAERTSGGLKKNDLFQDKNGNIKSKRASKAAKKNQNLKKAGWTYQKGRFGAVRIEEVNTKKKSAGTKSKGKGSKKRGSKKKGSKKKGSKKK